MPPVPPGPPTPDRPAKTAGPGAWLSQHRNATIAGVVGVVFYALYRRSHAAAPASTVSTSSGLPVVSTAAMPTAGYDSSVLDSYNQLSGSISSLNDQVQALQASNAAAAAGSTSGGSAAPTVPAPGQPAPVSPVTLETMLDSQVGALSTRLGRSSTPAQVAGWQAQGLTPFQQQTQNVGVISQGLNTPTQAQIDSLAAQMAGGPNAYGGLPGLQQQQYAELANVQLLGQLNH